MLIETTAQDIRTGDRIAGTKFVNGQWGEDHSSPVTFVQEVMGWDHRVKVNVEFANGSDMLYARSAPVKIVRD